MLETLVGRLKWERTCDGIRVVIPARMSWGAIRNTLEDLGVYIATFLGLFLIVGCIAWFRGLGFRSYLNSEAVYSLGLCSLGCCTGLILARMIPRVFGETVVNMTPVQLTIEWKMRLRRSKDVYPTATLHSLRFIEHSGEISVQNKLGQNEIQFGHAHWTSHFGAGVTREEAEALITKMNQVYPFSSSSANESAPQHAMP